MTTRLGLHALGSHHRGDAGDDVDLSAYAAHAASLRTAGHKADGSGLKINIKMKNVRDCSTTHINAS